MRVGELVSAISNSYIWDVNGAISQSKVIGRVTANDVYTIIDESIHEYRLLCPNGSIGWVRKGQVREFG